MSPVCRNCAGRTAVQRSDGKWVKCPTCSPVLARATAISFARARLASAATAYETDRGKATNLAIAISGGRNLNMNDHEIAQAMGWNVVSLKRFCYGQTQL